MRSRFAAGFTTSISLLSETLTTNSSSARSSLPEGTVAVAAGLIISGVCAFAFLGLSKKALLEQDQKVIQQLWFWTFALAPGFFLPLEQEVGRALSHRRSLGQGGLPVVRRAATIGAAIALILLIGLVAFGPLLTRNSFEQESVAVIALMVAVVAWGSSHLGRGILAGSGRFRPYGLLMSLDGLFRVIGCLVLAALGVHTLFAYALLIGIPPVLALAVAFSRQSGVLQPGPEAPWTEVSTNLSWLVLASVAGAFLLNAGPLLAHPLASVTDKAAGLTWSTTTKDASRLGAFEYSVLLSRLPLFMFQAVQAALLPKLARIAALGAYDEFRRGFKTLLKIVGVVAVLGVIGTGVLGPLAVRIAYGVKTSNRDMALLAVASGLYMVAVSMAQALIALHRHPLVAIGWILGVIGVVPSLFLSRDLLLRVELALAIGSLIPAVYFSVALLRTLRHPSHIDAGSITEALLDHPLTP